MKIQRVIEIDDETYNESQIKEMSVQQLIQFIAFLDNEQDLNLLKEWRKNDDAIVSRIDRLLALF